MAPIVHGLEAEYADRMVFSYLDIDDAANAEVKKTLNFRVQPHFVLLDAEGNVIRQWFGTVKAEDFRAAFDEALAE